MEVRFNPPADRGVTTLMYVGDDDAVEKAVAVGDLFDPVAGMLPGVPNIVLFAGLAAVGYALYKRGASTKRRG